MPLFETEAGLTWEERARRPGFAGVLDPGDDRGIKNLLIDRVEKHVLARELGDVRGLRILDFGCGVGRLTRWLTDRGASVAGIDASPHMIEVGRQREPELELAVVDTDELPFPDESFDVALSVGVLSYYPPEVEPIAVTCREFHRVLRPGGRAVLVEQAHEGSLGRGSPLSVYRDALRAAGFGERRVEPVRFSHSRVVTLAHRLPPLARAPLVPALIAREARSKVRPGLAGDRYADFLVVGEREA